MKCGNDGNETKKRKTPNISCLDTNDLLQKKRKKERKKESTQPQKTTFDDTLSEEQAQR